MRDIAASHLRRRHVDLNGLFRGLLLNPSTPAKTACIALEGLRETQDVALIEQFAHAAAPALRLAALASWLRIAPGRKDDIALLALRDTAPSVRRFGVDTVRRQGAYLPFEQAQAILAPLRDYRNLLELARLDPWQWLETLVWVAADDTLDMATIRMLDAVRMHGAVLRRPATHSRLHGMSRCSRCLLRCAYWNDSASTKHGNAIETAVHCHQHTFCRKGSQPFAPAL